MQARLTNYFKAGYTGLYLLSHEEFRATQEVVRAAQAAGRRCVAWDCVNGLVALDDKPFAKGGEQDVLAPLKLVLSEATVLILRDYQLFLKSPEAPVVRSLLTALDFGAGSKDRPPCTYVLISPYVQLPPELEKRFQCVEFGLPDRARLAEVFHDIAACAKVEIADLEPLLNAASGLTLKETADAAALSFVETKNCLSPQIVAREKAATLRKNGLLEVIDSQVKPEDIGGLDSLKTWVAARQSAFSQEAREWGLPLPRGFLMLGIPGCGKSTIAKATAGILGVPLLKLDAGKLFGSLVGQSEANTRAVIETAEAIAPCVLWIDELDKGFSGTQSSGSTDGGTGSRVYGTFLQWMQDKTKPVFVVATANDVSKLDSALLRKGRFDEQWFVDLPNPIERKDIWKVVTRRAGRPECYAEAELAQLVGATEGFSGAEIEAVFNDALYSAFNQSPRPKHPTVETVIKIITETTPLSTMMAEQIKCLREWCRNRAKPATAITAVAPVADLRRVLSA